ncbi:MAG: hypothetical protein LBV44_03440 [Methylobacillus sp.]|jgi:hypothetical protein|nr:hypothetical protein [Methylobacillus sp.]
MKLKEQLIVQYQDEKERDRLLDKLHEVGFKCGHPLCKFEMMSAEDKNSYFKNLPFIIDFENKTFSATNITCLAAAKSSDQGKARFVDADWLTNKLG